MEELAFTCGCAARAVSDILVTGFRVDVSKALNPLHPADYLTIVGRLSRALSRATADTETEILRKAVDNLDVDWPNLTAAARSRVIRATQEAVGSIPARVIPAVEARLRVSGPAAVRGARTGTREVLSATLRSRIGVSLTERDRRIVDHLVGSQAHYVRDEYGRRVDAFSRRARDIVAGGLDQGLGRDEISTALGEAFTATAGIQRSASYWSVIAGTFMNRSRTWGQLTSYEEAGIERYVFEAVLDERTTDQCAALHGRTFEVSAGIQRYETVAASSDPEAVIDVQPWLRVGKDDQGRRVLYTQDRAGSRTLVGVVTQSRVGSRDALPKLAGMKSTAQLQEMGLLAPPLHGACRSTIVADV